MYLFSETMSDNPWQVDTIGAFWFLKCPECTFDTKKENIFQEHAVENHPQSFVLFLDGIDTKEEIEDNFFEIKQEISTLKYRKFVNLQLVRFEY